MFELYTFGTNVRTAAAAAAEGGGDVDLAVDPTAAAPNLPPPSPPLPATPHLPSAAAAAGADLPLSRPPSVESLTRRLDEQHLRPPDHPSAVPPATVGPGLELELWLDDQLGQPASSAAEACCDGTACSSLTPTLAPSAVPGAEASQAREDPAWLTRQLTAQFNNNNNNNNNALNSTSIQTQMERMMATGHRRSLRPPPPPSPPPAPAPAATDQDDDAVVKMDLDMGILEVDEAYGEGSTSNAPALEDLLAPRRAAAAPAGTRKRGPLQYHSSADMALRCPNVVRSAPRMRRRTKREHRKASSSTATSSVDGASVAHGRP